MKTFACAGLITRKTKQNQEKKITKQGEKKGQHLWASSGRQLYLYSLLREHIKRPVKSYYLTYFLLLNRRGQKANSVFEIWKT